MAHVPAEKLHEIADRTNGDGEFRNAADDRHALRQIANQLAAPLADRLSDMQSEIELMPCTRKDKAGRACTHQHEDKRTRDGRPLFWFGIDCNLPREKFCDACLAYWLIAVTRNVMISIARHDAYGKRERGES